MEIGATKAVQDRLKTTKIEESKGASLVFCWDTHLTKIKGRNVLFIVNASNRYTIAHMEHTDGEILADIYYSHDLNGNRTLKSGSRIGGAGKATEHKISYVYDRMDRLVTETYQGEETAYVYDLCGNRLKKLDKSGTEESWKTSTMRNICVPGPLKTERKGRSCITKES